MRPSRRTLIQAAMATALSACSERSGHASEARPGPVPPLKTAARFPVGTCLSTDGMADPETVALVLRHFSQITPEWEMKMERVLADDGGYRFEAADAIARFCAGNGLKLHATTLVWYSQDPAFFHRMIGERRVFEQSYRDYIARLVTRYRGLARGWDVVNEAVAEDGHGYRGGIWEQALGPDYARIAFETARQADPGAVLFLNDYNLETNPVKLDSFQRLLERLLKAGAPVTGIGTQTHVPVDLEASKAGAAIRALARFGLPIHVSELDVTTRHQGWLPGPSDPDRLAAQARVVGELAEAFMALPPAQRYAFTVWGVRDKDSWLSRGPNASDGGDQPLLFDDAGNAKPAFDALRAAFARG